MQQLSLTAEDSRRFLAEFIGTSKGCAPAIKRLSGYGPLLLRNWQGEGKARTPARFAHDLQSAAM